jgi:hypothetical protein
VVEEEAWEAGEEKEEKEEKEEEEEEKKEEEKETRAIPLNVGKGWKERKATDHCPTKTKTKKKKKKPKTPPPPPLLLCNRRTIHQYCTIFMLCPTL